MHLLAALVDHESLGHEEQTLAPVLPMYVPMRQVWHVIAAMAPSAVE